MMEDKSTVLVVDDTSDNIELLKHILQDKYKVKASLNGKQALKIIEQSDDIDIILLDIMMPDMDGYEVIQHLKSNKKTENIPVIFISAKGETFDQTKGFSLGAADYIVKPISPPVVLARVAAHVSLNEKRKKLEKRVEEEIKKRMQKELLLIHQSRLASMGEMMRAITHQWNQPLNIISMISSTIKFSIMMGELDKDTLTSQIDDISKNIEFMSETMKDFKNFFKAGKNRVSFGLHKEIHDLLSMLKPMFHANGIEVEIDIDEEMFGYGVPGEFKQVVLNLLSNAKDVIKDRMDSSDGSFEGKINIYGHIENGNNILEISDNGGGIPEKDTDKIFTDYFTTKKEDGTGIGLTMSKMIIKDEFNGELRFENKDDGACFIIDFPQAKDNEM